MKNNDLLLELKMNSLKYEMDRLETENRLEPDIMALGEGESIALFSIAISLKRIADVFDRRTPGERVLEAHIKMVNGLAPRAAHYKLDFSAMMKLVGDYFYKRTHIQSDEL